MSKPDFCILDSGPLITFMTGGALDELTAASSRFQFKILDVVALEAGRKDKPGGIEISNWIDDMKERGMLDVIETEVGRELRDGREKNPKFKIKGAGEHAIAEWLQGGGADGARLAVVVFEDDLVRSLMKRLSVDANIDAATTRGFITAGEKLGFVKSADDTWNKIHAAAPTRRPETEYFQVSRKAPAP